MTMQLPHLDITSVHGHIGMKSQRPHIQIKQHNADLSIKQEHVATLKISQKAAKLFIDQTEAFADANLKGPLRSSDEFVANTKQKVMAYISKQAGQGDQLMKIENGGSVIPGLAKQDSELYPEKQLNIALMPRPFQVKFQVEPSDVEITVNRTEPEINVTRREPTIQHRRWETDVYVKQKNSISFQIVNHQVNRQL